MPFFQNFINLGESPLLSIRGYTCLVVFLPALVIPAALVLNRFFAKFGLPLTCIGAMCFTGIVTFALLMIANINPPSAWTLAAFIITIYLSYPITVLSQLAASPMLDRIAPIDKRGYVQGVFSTNFNLTLAISPWLLGLLADYTSTKNMILFAVLINFVGALLYTPLIFHKYLQRTKPNQKRNSGELDSEKQQLNPAKHSTTHEINGYQTIES
mmetsp:Transcript_788/g.1243  ORF Transcript_788/g.1243 Transcript_788/m.1243 type:complete len:213 (-) Transcript_788:43-681(-)